MSNLESEIGFTTDSRRTKKKNFQVRLELQSFQTAVVDYPPARQPYRQPRNTRIDRYSPEPNRSDPPIVHAKQHYVDLTLSCSSATGAKLRVDNLHYDLTEDELEVVLPFLSAKTRLTHPLTRTCSPVSPPLRLCLLDSTALAALLAQHLSRMLPFLRQIALFANSTAQMQMVNQFVSHYFPQHQAST